MIATWSRSQLCDALGVRSPADLAPAPASLCDRAASAAEAVAAMDARRGRWTETDAILRLRERLHLNRLLRQLGLPLSPDEIGRPDPAARCAVGPPGAPREFLFLSSSAQPRA